MRLSVSQTGEIVSVTGEVVSVTVLTGEYR